MIGQTISHYRIVEKLGEGGMGVVYKAEDTKLARVVALKFLGAHLLGDHEAKQRFLREAQAAAALNHPNICTVHEIDEAEGRTFIAMAFVEGESLEGEIARGPLPIKEALDVAHQIAKGLQAAHNKGIIHRDIKPANILLARDGPVTIMDFGLARLTEASRLTKADTTMGTVAYMSPEQAQGHEIDHRSDIWSLGVVLYEMICGQRPFRGEYDQALCYEIVNEEPAPLTGLRTGVPMELEWMVGKALAKQADHRYQQAQELAVDLVNLSDKLRSGRSEIFRAGISSAPGTKAVSPRWHGQNRATWALGALALLALATALVLALVRFRATPSEIPAYELTVDLPPGTTIHTFSLSPDGRHVALALTQQRGERRLWVRSMHARLPREVPGTAGAQYPFWSPDSRSIGFFAQKKLKKVALAGGPPQALCDADEGRGGTWNAAGVILFAPTPFGQLLRVSEGGGEPVAVTKSEESAPQVSRRFPWFLPDGRHFLYTDRTTLRDRAGIYVSSIEGSEPRRLLPDDANAVYAPGDTQQGGFILFVRDNNLLAQPFDSGSLELTGDAFPVAESVGGVANIGTYGFTASAGGSLVYVSGGGSFLTFWDSQLAWFDRTGEQLQPLGKPASYLGLSLSPDETKVALDIGEAGRVDIWLLEFARGTLSRLTTKSVDAAWSADGTRIAFTSARDGLPRIYRKAASGVGEDETLVSNDASSPNVRLMDWSPDGRFLLYSIQQPKTTIDLWVLPLEGDRKPFVFVESEFREDLPRFSPDSRWVAYQSEESGRFEVYIRPFPGADRKWQISTEGGSTPVWSKDGRELYYIAPDLKLMAVALKAGDTIEAGPPQARFQTRLPMLNYGPVAPLYEVSRDGRFLMSNRVDDGQQSEQRTLVHVTNWRAKLGK